MDIYLQIVIDPPTHTPVDPDVAAALPRRGDIVGGGLASSIATLSGSNYDPNDVIGSPRLGFIFLRDVPNRAIQRIRRLANGHSEIRIRQRTIPAEVYDNREPGSYGPFVSEPTLLSRDGDNVTLEGEVLTKARASRWGFRASDIPAGARNQLLSNRHITLTWTQARSILRDNILDRYITDSDLD